MNFEWARDLSDEQWAAALAREDHRTPALPPSEVQSSFVGSSGLRAYDECKVFWRLTTNYLRSSNGDISVEDIKVLDVGVGWGRIYRWLLRDVSPRNLVGVDVDSKAIAMCTTAMPYGQFVTVSPGQPYPGAPYDLAVAYSVFSHLSETAARSVLHCARAALRPNGLMALTTLRPAHIDVWAGQTTAPYYGEQLAAQNFDRVEWWERATDGQHLYVQTGGGDPSRPPDAYGEAVVPKSWWEHVDGFKLVAFERRNDLPQSYVVLQAV